MALNKTAKIWLIALSIPIAIIIIAITALKLYFTGDRLKAMILPRIQETTHRTVGVSTVSFSIFPTLAISLDSLTVSNPAGSSFDVDRFITLENLRVNINVLKLLSNRLEISKILLQRPRIYLETTADGRKNYSAEGVSASEGSGGQVRVEKGGTGSLLLSNLEIEDGELEVIDKKYNSRMALEGINQTVRVESAPGEASLHIEGSSTIDRFSYGTMSAWYLKDQPVSASSKLVYDIDKDVLTLTDVKAKVRDLPLAVTGTLSQLQEKTMNLDLTVSSPGAGMGQLLSLVPPEMLKKASGLESSGTVAFTLTIKGPSSTTLNPGINASFSVADGTIHYASLPKSITGLNLRGTFDKPSAPVGAKGIGSFGLETFAAALGGSRLTGSMKMADFDDPSVTASFKGSVDLSEVKTYYPLEPGTELGGTVRADVSVDGKVNTPQRLKAGGTMEFQGVTIKPAGSTQPVRNLNGTVSFNNQIVSSKQLTMAIGESDLAASFALKNYLGMVMGEKAQQGATPSATVTLTSHQLRTADLMPESTTPPPKGSKPKESRQTASLLPGVDLDANVRIDKLVTDKFTFNNAHGALAMAGGVITLKNFNVDAFQGSIASKGTLDLRKPDQRPFNLDLAINKVESNDFLPEFTSFGKYLFGKLSMNTTMQGDLNDTLGLQTKTLLGKGNVQIADGKLLGLPLAQKLAEATSLTELREVDFKSWANAFTIADGRLVVKDLKVDAGSTNFLVGGSQGLDGSLDYGLTVKLPQAASSRLNLQGVAGDLLQYFKDKDGRVNLTFQVTGTSTSPVLRLDTQAQQEMAKKAVEQKANELKGKAEDELKKKATEGLKKLLKRP